MVSLSIKLKALGRRLGIDATFQRLRRSWATRAEALGVPQGLISRTLRHASQETSRTWYQARDMEALRDALERFDF